MKVVGDIFKSQHHQNDNDQYKPNFFIITLMQL